MKSSLPLLFPSSSTLKVAALSALALSGCADRPVATIDPTQYAEVRAEVPIDRNRELDILFVIDNSPSMATEQQSLRDNFFRIIQALQPAGSQGLPSLRIGVVTTDLGAGTACTPTNPLAGQLVSSNGGCRGPNGRFIEDLALPDGSRMRNYSGTLEQTFSCMATVGAGGCGFEMPLEAMRRVLAPGNTFLRPNAYLAVVFITDEDDCSTRDFSMFADESPSSMTSRLGLRVSFRCWEFGVTCDPVANFRAPGLRQNCRPKVPSQFMFDPSEYAPFLRTLKPYPGQLLLASIAGPAGTVEVVEGNDRGTRYPEIKFVCPPTPGSTRTVAEANPPVRLNTFLDAFGQNVTRTSICNENLGPAVQQIANFFGERLSPCLRGGKPKDVNPNTPELDLDCNVAEVTMVPETGRLREKALQACSNNNAPASSNNLPCYTLKRTMECSTTESGLALETFYPPGVTVPPGTRAVARCVAGN